MQWSQDEAIAFECARDVITELMAIQSGQIFDESSKPKPNAEQLASLHAARSKLARERAGLHVDSFADIARIRKEYGAVVRAWREQHSSPKA